MAVLWRMRLMQWIRVCAVAAFAVVLVASVKRGRILSSASLAECDMKDMIATYGWSGAVHRFRETLVVAAIDMKKNDLLTADNSSDVIVDITPFHDIISRGIDTFGVAPMVGEVFHDIEWYFPKNWYRPKSKEKKKRCNWHGIGCEYYEVWFIWHYVGAIMAEKLLKEGSLLLDASTGTRLMTPAQVMDEIHGLQERPHVTRMSFHAEHGFIWAYLASTSPDLDSFPLELANEFCGKYDKPHYVPSVKKHIGSECYHGFGHAIWEVLALRQLRSSREHNYTASSVFRPQSGFVLSDEAFCQGYRICQEVPEYPKAARKMCHGGMTHSAWLFGPRDVLPKSKRAVNSLFREARDKCERMQ